MTLSFSTTAISVLLLVAMAIPGYLLIKSKLVKPSSIAALAAILLYVSQPFLSLRSFLQVDYTPQIAINLAIVFGISLLLQMAVFCVLWLILCKRFDNPIETEKFKVEGYFDGGSDKKVDFKSLPPDVQNTARGRAYRVMTLVSTFGNVGFFGVPVLQIIFNGFEGAAYTIAYSAVYIVSMNLMCWTIGAYVLTGNKKYVSIKKAILNPQTLTLFVALPLFFAGVSMSDIEGCALPQLATVINYLADMTAPLCMVILGMRFAVAPMKEVFSDWRIYVSTAIKNFVFPIIVWAVLLPFDMDWLMRVTLIILSGMPSASINLNLSELYNADQKTAANAILLSTLVCIISIPAIVSLANVTI